MKILNKKAMSIIEYMILLIIIIGAFLVMRSYIQRGFHGSWAKAGQAYGYGRQYDPQQTVECGFDDVSNRWYDRNCYEYYINLKGCSEDANCQESIITNGTCQASSCSQLNNGETL